MKIKISLLIAGLLCSSTLSADSMSLNEALTNGKVKGDLSFFWKSVDGTMFGKKDANFVAATINLDYESDSFNGFSTALGARATHSVYEKNDNDFDNSLTPRSVFHTANIAYTNKYFKTVVGRQLFDFEWANEDFHEGYSIAFNAPQNTTISFAHSERIASATNFMKLADFDKITKDPYGAKIESDGLNIFDLRYEGIKDLFINAYYYDLSDIANWYGAKVDYNFKNFGVLGQFSKSSEDLSNVEDGAIYKAEARAKFFDTKFSTGFISSDEDGGVGSMDTMDDDTGIPVDEGRHVFDPDAETTYVGIAKKFGKIGLKTIYAETKYGDKEEQELNIKVFYPFSKNLKLFAKYIDMSADDSKDDVSFVKTSLEYTF